METSKLTKLRFEILQYARDQLCGIYYARLEELRSIPDEHSRSSAILDLEYPTNDQIFIFAERVFNYVSGLNYE
jgi:uncharacterized protein (DUF608 family)